jgi:hypothetical protein
MDDIVVENFSLRQRLNAFESAETDRDTLRTASKIRSEIKKMSMPYSFPYFPAFSTCPAAVIGPTSFSTATLIQCNL